MNFIVCFVVYITVCEDIIMLMIFAMMNLSNLSVMDYKHFAFTWEEDDTVQVLDRYD